MADFSTLPAPPAGLTGWPWREEQASAQPDNHDWPRISIVTPSYNQGAFLEATIRSALLQGYPDLEYILVDGGSTDNSLDIIRRYAPWLAEWSSAVDRGPADAINRGFSTATGNILAWLNADDLYAPGALRRIAEAFVNEPSTRLIYGEGWYIDENGAPIEPCRFVRRTFNRRYLINRDPILQPAAFWRRDLWGEIGPLDTRLQWVFDWEWFIRAHKQTNFRYLPHTLAYYRVQPAARTRTGGPARQLEHGRVSRQYGGWWQPNHIVQQLRRLAAFGRSITEGWPRPAAAPIRLLSDLPRLGAEVLLRDMYMR